MPIMPTLPPTPAQLAVPHPHHPQPVAVPVPHATAPGVRGQTAKAVKHAGESDGARRARAGTDSSVDEEANALAAKAQRKPGAHRLDVEI
jgi:hypothetical protein